MTYPSWTERLRDLPSGMKVSDQGVHWSLQLGAGACPQGLRAAWSASVFVA